MAVRNISAIGKRKPIPVVHFIPPSFSPIWKLEVVTDTETLDLTEILVDGSYLDGVTNTIGDFSFKIVDPDNTYSDKISEYDTLNVYIDYGTTATTLRFSGKIERKSNQDEIYLNVSGRSIAMITAGINVTYSGVKARSVILAEIIAQYFSTTVTTDIEADLTEMDANWEETPFWSVVEEICTSGGRDAYISSSSVFNYFLKGSRKNTTEAVVEEHNLIETTDYAKDTQDIYTKVRVYGKKIGGIPLIATSTSDTSQTSGISKEYKIDNSSVDSLDQATELADAVASDKKIPPTIGTITSLMLPSILPGEQIKIANPINNIPPDYYQINSYRQSFGDLPTTELIIQKSRVDLAAILKSNIKFKTNIPDNLNKNDMNFSQVIGFDSDTGVHSDTEITEGSLRVVSGKSVGTWISNVINLDSDITQIEFRKTGENLTKLYGVTTSYIWFSLDGGTTWKIYTTDTTEVPTGRDLKIRIDLNSSDATVDAVAVLYK